MARRRRRRRRRNPLPLAALANPINNGDWTPILVGGVGGALAMYLYLKTVATPATGQTMSLTMPATGQTATPPTG